MNAEEIRAMIPNKKTLNFKALLSDDPQFIILVEIAAQLAELNYGLKIILNPPLGYDTSKIDLTEWPQLPHPVLTVLEPRMTLRDQFAIAALNVIFSAGEGDEFWLGSVKTDANDAARKSAAESMLRTATMAYRWADKMMEARK
jgi:hypothetical protein